MLIIPIFGTPSPLTYWITSFARTVSDILFGSHYFITPVTIEDLREAWDMRDGRSVVLHSEIPQRAVIDLFINLEAPIFVVADDPIDVIGYLKASRDLDFRSATRLASQSISILRNLRYENAELVDTSWHQLPVSQLLYRIAGHFGMNIPDEKYDEIMARFARSGTHSETILSFVEESDPLACRPGRFVETYDPIEEQIVRKVIKQYGDMLQELDRNIIVWPPQIFPDRDNLNQILDGPRSLVGPARILFGGHTLHLPAGAWTATIELEVGDNFSGNRLLSQIYSGDRALRTVSAKLPTNGRFEYEVDFVIEDAFYPVQVLIAIAEGAIEGDVALHSCRFTRRHSTDCQTA